MKARIFFIRGAALIGYRQLAVQVGLNPNTMLRRLKIDRKALVEPDILISSQAFVELLELSAALSGCSDFGLRLSQDRGVKSLGPIGLLALNEPDVEHAVSTMSNYLHLHNEGLRFRLETMGEISRLCFYSEFGTPRSTRQVVELSLGVAVSFFRLLQGEGWNPIDIYFCHSAPSDTATHRRLFRAPIHFDQEFNGLTFASAVLKEPIRSADDLTHKYLLSYIRSLDTRHGDDIVSKTRRVVIDLVSSGRLSKEVVARYMGIGPRTLQRKLEEHGYTFKQLTDEVRASLASQHLSNSHKPLTEVAELLGYSELSAFSRFFQRIFGKSPSDWRRESRS